MKCLCLCVFRSKFPSLLLLMSGKEYDFLCMLNDWVLLNENSKKQTSLGLDWSNIFKFIYFLFNFFFLYCSYLALKNFFAQLHQNTILVSGGAWSLGPYVTGETTQWNINANRCYTSFCSPLQSILVYVIMWFLRGNNLCWQMSLYWVQHWTAEMCCKFSSLNSVIQQSHHPSWEIWK